MSMPTARPISPPASLLQAEGLACRRGRRLLFRGLNLQLQAGSVTWLRGSNGCGKTSLLRILAGLSAATEGRVTWPAAGAQDTAAQSSSPLIYIGHSNGLKDDLTLLEALAFLAKLAGLDRAEARAGQALQRLGLATRAAAPVRTLSQGQRRRGALARLALDDGARVWLLDEPFDALDADSIALLQQLIAEHAARGGAALLTSHQAIDLKDAHELDLEAWRAA